jgi:hypothetical protein
MNNSHRVYNDRTNETLFTGDVYDCSQYMIENFDEEDEDFAHIWMETVKG